MEEERGPERLDGGDRLTIDKTLGQGGMGIVWQGTQRSLRRTVAIKSLRPEFRSPELRRSPGHFLVWRRDAHHELCRRPHHLQ